MQVIMLFRRNLDDGNPFDGIEIVKVMNDDEDAVGFIEQFELHSDEDDDISNWFWQIEPHGGSVLPPDIAEDLGHPYKG